MRPPIDLYDAGVALDVGSRAAVPYGNTSYTPSGRGALGIRPGEYRVIASRGPEWDVAWVDVPARVVREDEGTDGRAAAGFVYEADVSAIAAVAGAVELRIVVTDPGGNKSTWTLAPAFRIDASRRERPVRR